MEAVKTFNSELFSMNDYKPPISKAKMTQITKLAIKAIKFYKHVVQSVEKFIQKCKPEYKVPGLYVIDSIVRQSRHQFGQDKDLFAPRFCINIINTFQNLYRCAADDKSKIVRVLNLWQKNNVFKSEIIQPLLDMAAGINPPVAPVFPSAAPNVGSSSGRRSTQVVKHWVRSQEFQGTSPGSPLTPHVIMGTPVTPVTQASMVQGLPDPWATQITNTDTLTAVAQILQSPQGQQLQQLVQTLQIQQQKPQPSLLQALDAGLVVQLQALTAQLTAAAAASNTLNPLEQTVSLSKRLMDTFDFVDDTDNAEESKVEAPNSQLPLVSESMNNSLFHQLAEHLQQQNLEHFRQQLMEQQPAQVIAQESQETQEESQEVTFGSENSGSPSQGSSQQFLDSDPKLDDSRDMQQEDMELEEVPEEQDVTEEEIFEQEEKKSVLDSRSRTLSRSHSRSPRKRRSRSRSGSRKRKHRKRSRSRSRERERERDRKRKPTSRSYSSERRAREREKERQKKGLPPIRSKTLSVCSTTLWVGQVDKKATQQDLTNLFEEFGQVESINMIPPRGCAYVCMVHRQDAYRARQKLSAGACKLISKIIKIAWALNKGVKMEYKQFWDVDLGVTYIPWEKVKLDDLRGFAEGGMIDQETMNGEWESLKISEPVKEVKTPPPATTTATVTIATTHVQSAPVPKTPMITTQAAAAYAPMITTQAAAAYAPMITTQAAAAYAPMITTQAAAAYAPMMTTQAAAAYAPMMTTQGPAAYAPMMTTQAPAAYAPMISTQSAAAYAPMISTQTAAAYNPMITTQAGAPYTQPVTLLQIPVPPTVPTVSMVPPVFPISMSVPPPGYVMPPPPFLRPAFDPTQPPPGYMPPPIPPPTMVPPPSIPPPTITTSLIQPPMSITQETMKDMSFSSLVLPAASVSTSHATPTVSSASVYNPPQSSQGESEEKQCKLSDNPISSTESTATSAVQSNVSSSSAVLGGPAPITTHSMSHLNLSGRMHGMPFLDGQPGLLTQSHGPRFAFMQPGMPPQRNVPPPAIIDPSIPPPPQGPFPPGDFFNRTERSYVTPVQNADNTSNAEKRVQLGSDGIQQEGDRDYRFPPRENRENLNRPAPLEASDGRPVDPQEGLVRQVVAADDVMGRPSVNTQDNQRLVVDARDGLLRHGTDARDGLLRPGTDAREGQLRQGIDAREGFHRQGADSRDSLLRPAADSHEGLQRPGTDLQESLQRAASDSREFQQRMRAGSREALLRQGADSRDGIPRPGMGPREGLLGPGPDSREGLLRLGTFPREGLLGPGPDVREGLLRLRTFPREGLLGDRPVARDNQGRLGSELHEGHGRQESDTEEVRDWPASDTREGPNWPGSSAQEVHNWPRSDAREIHDWQGSDAREGHDWPGSDAHEGQRHPAAELHEVLLRLGTHARESPGRPPLDMRQHLGRPLLDARQPFGRAPIDEREHFGRLPMDGREPFGRPPMEGRETFGRPPVEGRDLYGRLPMEGREVFGRPPMEGRELFVRLPLEGREQFGRPPVDMRDNHGRQSLDAIGRRENFGFNTENKHWGHRDFDERQHHPLPVFGGPQGFHEDRDRFHHGNLRPDIASGPMFNRGLDQDAHRDLDDRRSLWERQRERDDRDVDFRREIINGNRFGRDRQQDTWVPPKPQIFEYFEGTASPTSTSTTPTSSPEKVENLPQINGESTEADSPPPPVETNKDTELSDKLVPMGEISKEKSDTEADIKSQPVVESTETEGT